MQGFFLFGVMRSNEKRIISRRTIIFDFPDVSDYAPTVEICLRCTSNFSCNVYCLQMNWTAVATGGEYDPAFECPIYS